MDTVRVYRYELYDPVARDFVRQMPYVTEQAIVALRGLVMYATGKDVDSEEVESQGIWAPPSCIQNRTGSPPNGAL
jgi:hypothetical protein